MYILSIQMLTRDVNFNGKLQKGWDCQWAGSYTERNFKSDSNAMQILERKKNHKSKVREPYVTASFWTPGLVISVDSVFEF